MSDSESREGEKGSKHEEGGTEKGRGMWTVGTGIEIRTSISPPWNRMGSEDDVRPWGFLATPGAGAVRPR